MNCVGFEMYLKSLGVEREDEINEVVSKARWIETTMDVSLDRMLPEEIKGAEFKKRLEDLIGPGEKADGFCQALSAYSDYLISADRGHEK